MPVVRLMNQATSNDAMAAQQFNVVPRTGAIGTLYATCVTSGDVLGLLVGEKVVVPIAFQPNIESSADVIDVSRDRVITEQLPPGQIYMPCTATTAVNAQLNLTYL